MIIDIHTHLNPTITSSGIHPFDAHVATCEELSVVERSDSMIIGEIGLDYRPQYRSARQQQIFESQIMIANRLRRPIIVHQVKALDDTLRLLRAATVPVIFHGFSGSLESARRILGNGFYLSFGHHILRNTRLQAVMQAIPLEQIFLETDDSGIPIEQIYVRAAQILGITQNQLEIQITKNLENVRLDAENPAAAR